MERVNWRVRVVRGSNDGLAATFVVNAVFD
jgi:hypothetical protein